MPAEPARWGASVTSPVATRRGVRALRLHWLHASHERRHERQSSDTVECGTAAHLNLIKKMIIDVLRGPVRIDPVGAARAPVPGSIERHPSPSSCGASVSIFSAAPHSSSSRPNLWNGSKSLVFSVRRAVVPDVTAATQAPIERDRPHCVLFGAARTVHPFHPEFRPPRKVESIDVRKSGLERRGREIGPHQDGLGGWHRSSLKRRAMGFVCPRVARA